MVATIIIREACVVEEVEPLVAVVAVLQQGRRKVKISETSGEMVVGGVPGVNEAARVVSACAVFGISAGKELRCVITRVRDNILKSKEQKNIQPTKGGHKMVTCQNYVSLYYCQITSCPSDGGIS